MNDNEYNDIYNSDLKSSGGIILRFIALFNVLALFFIWITYLFNGSLFDTSTLQIILIISIPLLFLFAHILDKLEYNKRILHYIMKEVHMLKSNKEEK